MTPQVKAFLTGVANHEPERTLLSDARLSELFRRFGGIEMTLQNVRRIESEVLPHALRVSERPATQKRVLCATDLSPRSQRAVARAALLTKQLDARLMLLHVIDPDEFTERSIDARNDIAQQLASTGVALDREPEILVRHGSYGEAIAALANEIDADVIVLGAQRRKALAPLLGTKAERIVALAGRPALIVNLDSHVRYGAVVIAAELSDAFIQVVQVASSLKFLDAGTVSIVHGFEFAVSRATLCRGL